jgi:hypothetical protein
MAATNNTQFHSLVYAILNAITIFDPSCNIYARLYQPKSKYTKLPRPNTDHHTLAHKHLLNPHNTVHNQDDQAVHKCLNEQHQELPIHS